jgi:predicted RNase H-like HicB family nuclease
MRRYIALIHADSDQGLAVTAPDFPGFVARAESLQGVGDLAAAALAAHIEAMERRGEPLPRPSSFEAMMADSRNADRAAILVRAKGSEPPRAGARAPEGNPNDEWPEADA